MYRKYIKRILDIIMSLVLIILTFPIMVIVALSLLINLGSPLWNQRRLREGINKKPFVMYKFRTRKINSYDLPYEERYTKFSYFIDRSHLNELPQLFNVLKGDMSLVGPRPFIPGEKLPKKPSKERYMVKPGMTSLAELYGGSTISHEDKLKCDVLYNEKISFLLDLKIIILTPFEIIKYK